MKVFLSWSGLRSKYVAAALKDWVPDLLLEIEPWMSGYDIDAGARWNEELTKELANCDFGIIVVSSDNVSVTSIHFEAGSLSKAFSEARVIPCLIDIKFSDLKWPLANFQSVEATEEGTKRLIDGLNAVLSNPIPNDRLSRIFERAWPDLEKRLLSMPQQQTSRTKRSERDLLEEILGTVRDTSQRIYTPEMAYSGFDQAGLRYPSRNGKVSVFVDVFWHARGFPKEKAEEYCAHLENNGLSFLLIQHRDPNRPNAIYIDALVDAESAYTVLSKLLHEVEYIFALEYNEREGGDTTGYKIGIGYMSFHNEDRRRPDSTPIKVTDRELNRLSRSGQTNTEFQLVLRRLVTKC